MVLAPGGQLRGEWQVRRILLLLLGIALVSLYLSIKGIGSKRESIAIIEKSTKEASNNNQTNLQNSKYKTGRNLSTSIDKHDLTFEELLQATTGTGKDFSKISQADSNASGQIVYDSQEGEGGLIYNGRSNFGESERGQYSGSSPELDALREIAKLNSNVNDRGSSLIPGIHVRRTPTPVENKVAVPTSTPTNELPIVGGQARGYTMLYLMHPKARQTVERQIDAMLRANIEELYLGVLTDGTFTRDYNYLTNVVRRIGRAGKALTLVLYLTNGPAMRNFEASRSSAPFSTTNPIDFRNLIQSDQTTREEFIKLVRPLNAVLQLNKRLNDRSRSFVIVMLEDNLDDASYLSMRRLAQGVIGTRATFLRNPCPACWDGNTISGLGDGVELHNPSVLASMTTSDGYSLDGQGYALQGETNSSEIPYEQVRNLMITSESRGLLYFGLWRHLRQGITPGIQPPHPDDRTYEVPSDLDLEAEIELLRTGLAQVQ